MRRLYRQAQRRHLLGVEDDGRSGRALESLERVGGVPRGAPRLPDPKP
jgi:hypothetical protein